MESENAPWIALFGGDVVFGKNGWYPCGFQAVANGKQVAVLVPTTILRFSIANV